MRLLRLFGASVRGALVFVLLLGLAAATHRAYATVSVTVDDDRVIARRGITVGELARQFSPARPGDVLSAVERRVVVPGGGRPIVVVVNGRVARTSAVTRSGDRVRAYSGTDVVEPVVIETRTVDPPTRVIGSGPLQRVVSEGSHGVEVASVGALSGEVVAVTTVTGATPRVVRRYPLRGAKVVALTFDDGPWPRQTDAVLSILAEKNVPATFFMLGSRVKAAPDVARRVVDAGHLVGNHTYRHARADKTSAEAMRSEVRLTNDEIRRATGIAPHWFRPAGGHLTPALRGELKRIGMRIALWNVDPQDWREDASTAEIVRSVVSSARPGAVILLHDGGGRQDAMIAALPRIIDGLRAAGYGFVTLDEL